MIFRCSGGIHFRDNQRKIVHIRADQIFWKLCSIIRSMAGGNTISFWFRRTTRLQNAAEWPRFCFERIISIHRGELFPGTLATPSSCTLHGNVLTHECKLWENVRTNPLSIEIRVNKKFTLMHWHTYTKACAQWFKVHKIHAK